jgi:hypothetical protein
VSKIESFLERYFNGALVAAFLAAVAIVFYHASESTRRFNAETKAYRNGCEDLSPKFNDRLIVKDGFYGGYVLVVKGRTDKSVSGNLVTETILGDLDEKKDVQFLCVDLRQKRGSK